MNQTQPPSALITWCTRLALTFLLLVPVSVFSVKFGLLHFSVGLGIFALSCIGALVMLLVLIVLIAVPQISTAILTP